MGTLREVPEKGMAGTWYCIDLLALSLSFLATSHCFMHIKILRISVWEANYSGGPTRL